MTEKKCFLSATLRYVQVDFNEIEENYDKAKQHQLITDNNNATYVNISLEGKLFFK